MSEMPRTIFRYEALSMQSLQNLKSQQIYFASPCLFNDPFDCAIGATIKEHSDEELESIRSHFLRFPEAPLRMAEMATWTKADLCKKFSKIAIDLIQSRQEEFRKNRGVCCYTERNDNLLMWSHYGGKYKGICLEFITKFEPFNKLRRVRYVDTIPVINLVSLLVEEKVDIILDLFCTKSKEWAYESEWRGFHNKAGTLFGYPPQALKAVYFGPEIDHSAMEIVCLTLRGQNEHVEYWKGTRSKSQFRVNFQKVDYMPYLEAQKKGLRS